MADEPKNTMFCTGQRLSVLTVRTGVREYLSGEAFFRERHAPDGDHKKSPWRRVKWDALVRRMAADGPLKRVLVVCAGGLGKTTTLRHLEYRLAAPGSRQSPFFLSLNEGKRGFDRVLTGLPPQATGLLRETILPVVKRLARCDGNDEALVGTWLGCVRPDESLCSWMRSTRPGRPGSISCSTCCVTRHGRTVRWS